MKQNETIIERTNQGNNRADLLERFNCVVQEKILTINGKTAEHFRNLHYKLEFPSSPQISGIAIAVHQILSFYVYNF